MSAVLAPDETYTDKPGTHASSGPVLIARLERLPVTRPVMWARGVVGMATFFDGYTTLSIAYALPVLAKLWHLTPTATAAIISSGYFGQLVGAVMFGWLAERIGRLPVLIMTIALFAVMSCACIFAWSAPALMLFRFLQGIGTGGEVPVASAYVNEFAGARRRGRFFLLYELLFLVGLVFAGLVGYAAVARFGWQAMFVVGLVPVLLVAPLSFSLFESPRWLVAHGRLDKAEAIIGRLERSAQRSGRQLDPINVASPLESKVVPPTTSAWREVFGRFYGPRTYLLWSLWFGAYLINNGLVTWLPTLYRTHFGLPVSKSIAYGFEMTLVAALASFVCALCIDKVGRRRWYTGALLLAALPLGVLGFLNAASAFPVFIFATLGYAALQTVTYSLYLYSGELYPTRLRAVGAGLGSAWLRAGSMAGPWVIGLVIRHGSTGPVFLVFATVSVVTGLLCMRFAPETSGRVLEEMSP